MDTIDLSEPMPSVNNGSFMRDSNSLDETSFMTQSFMGRSVYQYVNFEHRYNLGYILIVLTILFMLLNIINHSWYITVSWISTGIVEIGNMIYIYKMKEYELN